MKKCKRCVWGSFKSEWFGLFLICSFWFLCCFFWQFLLFGVCSLPFVLFYCRLTYILQFSHLFATLWKFCNIAKVHVLYNVIVIHNSLLFLIQFHVVNSIAFGHIFCVQPCFRIFSCCCVRHKVHWLFFCNLRYHCLYFASCFHFIQLYFPIFCWYCNSCKARSTLIGFLQVSLLLP